MELDDFCHLLQVKRTSVGCENPMLVTHGDVSPELWLAVVILGVL
ncbi:MAG: hypothetical protein AB1424_17150 [Thermodesulfobacteriota bacterium]